MLIKFIVPFLSQSTELDIVNGSFCVLCTFAVGLALHITVLIMMSPNGAKQLSTVAILLIGSCHVGVSKLFSRSISLAICCLYVYFFG